MKHFHPDRRRIRRSFGRISETLKMPDLIGIQKRSYETFLQSDTPHDLRTEHGLKAVFNSVFPIRDPGGGADLEFLKYELEEPKYDVEECQQRSLTFAAPLKVSLRLNVWNIDERTGERLNLKISKDQWVYLGDIPLMTESGIFIINGTERVIVSQMHRSPGIFYDSDRGRTSASGKILFSARVIPYRGSWLDFEFDAKDILHVRIDRRRKLPVTTLLYALDSARTAELRQQYEGDGKKIPPHEVTGMSRSEILSYFYNTVVYRRSEDDQEWYVPFDPEYYQGLRLGEDLVRADTGEAVVKSGDKLSLRRARQLAEEGLREIREPHASILGRYLAQSMLNEETGEVLYNAGTQITDELIRELREEHDVRDIPTLAIDNVNTSDTICRTMAQDKNMSREDALRDIYRLLRPGDNPLRESAEALFYNLFFEDERYDLSPVGRVRMNERLQRSPALRESDKDAFNTGDQLRILRKEDILAILRVLCHLKDGHGVVDDIDHLSNRRVRSVGELLENQYRIGLMRMERAIRERMNVSDLESAMPQDLINAKPIAATVREFFSSSQLSQFMDQTNPLSEITHKRRLSALGPGGLTRERAGFEVRDVHPTHYGRICPIETPEGPNIGLINSLATYAQINQYGFIESPYRRVREGRVQTDEIVYLSAVDEEPYTIAQANEPVDAEMQLSSDLIACRRGGEYVYAERDKIEYMDVSPKQVVSVAAALIPFLENDDANRALMGSNMQRQAVPLLRAQAPLVGTGMEASAARDSGAALVARRAGRVRQVDASRIVVRIAGEGGEGDTGVDIYNLRKFQRSNQNTCINQRPLVRIGDEVEAGEIIADGASTERGELALGRNMLCAFMSWQGYNFEDSILISEQVVRDDAFTSIHIEEYEIVARDTKLGPEEITRDIPNVSEEALHNLDESGIVYIGAEVHAGDILIGKVTPKGESPATPEEKLLRAIFGEKAADTRDTSKRLPPGVSGTVVDVRIFSRRGVDKDERTLAIEQAEKERLHKDMIDEQAILEDGFYDRLQALLVGHTAVATPKSVKPGVKIDQKLLSQCTHRDWRRFSVADDERQREIETLVKRFEERIKRLKKRFEDKVEKLEQGTELPPGSLKIVKVFIAVKRKLQPGDKMAGRHGNKGVISKIVPVEDMPHLEDGTPVDVILNPLGVPSRMNIGQILETHIGWGASGLGRKIGALVDECRRGGEFKRLRESLAEAYGQDADSAAEVRELSDESVVRLGESLRAGLPVSTPVFDGAREEDIVSLLEEAGLHSSGQVTLTDGRTGEKFERSVTVGYMYVLKLHHLVDEKIHARSTGQYSLVTQQPMGGKAQFGGQRFGEMEVWALEAYGAAYTLQEILTVKSDDVAGRSKAYEAIAHGHDEFETGIPESFNVLVKELMSLCLNIDLRQFRPYA
ncbi:MAG: DNA-directed RNA polymerase subunit beta [Alphaproteobacteria bacterium]|nr:DNA-directed RNA polymerase subunit beta [Alphaproteobacteria bacterium]